MQTPTSASQQVPCPWLLVFPPELLTSVTPFMSVWGCDLPSQGTPTPPDPTAHSWQQDRGTQLGGHTGTPCLIVLCFIEFHRHCIFHKLKARFFSSRKITNHFTVVVWNWTHGISGACTPPKAKIMYLSGAKKPQPDKGKFILIPNLSLSLPNLTSSSSFPS